MPNQPIEEKWKESNNMENSFDKTVEMIDEADAIFLSDFDKALGIVCGEPYNTKTGKLWAMAMLSTIEEAVKCKYKKVFDENDTELENALKEKELMQKSNWREEFDKKFPVIRFVGEPNEQSKELDGCFVRDTKDVPIEIKSFIENLLEQERQRMSEEIEKLKFNMKKVTTDVLIVEGKALEELLRYLKAIGPHSSLHFIDQLSEFILKTRQEAREEERQRILGLPCMDEIEVSGSYYEGKNDLRRELKEEINI